MKESIYPKNESTAADIRIQKISDLLEAKYIGTLSSGHMGSYIYKFQRLRDKTDLVIKQAPASNLLATEDIEANIFAYEKIKEIGGNQIIPPELRQIEIQESQTLVMKDLGKTFRESNITEEEYKKLWNNFEDLISKTSSDIKSLDAKLYSQEIISHIQRFAPNETEMLEKIRHSANALGGEGKAAIMLLDFTPDNIFLVDEKMFFIDPWKQETYLGHPAVSIGQFTTLVQLYKLKDAEQNSKILMEKCFARLPDLLGCNKDSIEFALKLGSTLQLVLSAYVRQESDPARSKELIDLAENKWV